ncbi:hypothetical protein HJC23_003616 [Cyclotella cryptica]|uniref:Uncharacterized protein n=1 Tax=Cyclotella cryptica TaxID=29204 RepID=A0ABD3QIW8_9STRA
MVFTVKESSWHTHVPSDGGAISSPLSSLSLGDPASAHPEPCLDKTRRLKHEYRIHRKILPEIYESDSKYSCYKWENFRANIKRLCEKNKISLPEARLARKSRKMRKKEETIMDVLWKKLREKKSVIQKMTNEAIYESNPVFNAYSFVAFNEEMKKLRVKLSLAEQQAKEYQTELKSYPRKDITCYGYPFWNRNAASVSLRSDVENGVADKLKPAELWESRDEYKRHFPLKVFRGHIYQEKRAQREKGYWVHEQNADGRDKRDREVEEMREECDILY